MALRPGGSNVGNQGRRVSSWRRVWHAGRVGLPRRGVGPEVPSRASREQDSCQDAHRHQGPLQLAFGKVSTWPCMAALARYSPVPGVPRHLKICPLCPQRFQRQAPACGSRLAGWHTCPEPAPEARLLTLVSHHWVMHSQQNRWPQGVAVECRRSSRHRVHRAFLEAALSSV